MRPADTWKDYELLDATGGNRLERWGETILIRPDPQVVWKTPRQSPLWAKADAVYHRSNQGGGEWEYRRRLPEKWKISCGEGEEKLTLIVSPTGFKHTGVFPEQAVNWAWYAKKIRAAGRPIKVLNLFGYTGGATLACAAAGATVCHVDASKGIVAWGKDNAEVTGGCDAFAMGVYSVNPDATVYIKTTNSWYDPEGEKQAAVALINEGCDVIGQHCDTPNPQLAAEEAGVFGVGYNSDMSKDAPKAVLTSTVWNWGAYYTKAVQDLIDGTWTGENYFGGLEEGLVDISPLSDLCVDGTQEKIDEARAKIESGDWDVFDGVIECNDGTTVGTEGEHMSDADITGNIHWYFKNIVEK